ncbi:hydroxymethylglutaryl-CoA reductase, degradative [Peredibacter starrii]|uniref:3-hydroxy-3-methylglutaryl coenzyme A reductase n=1 Tax=Peredibacter starrii TaxID=28202 RepID=A0AAX4HIR6_9BACT|nr:hydroxymethylglutaryl-CoA reductase, degradative [Peredibacter starrii]WPU63143.1 hydroxymethylglutaryl-CoA reductase, degradative [Peredibacter starrii]
MKTVSGFSKMSKEQKIEWLSEQLQGDSSALVKNLNLYWHQDQEVQKRFDEFSENTLTNYDLPFGLSPNFLINGKVYSVPMVIEESSVVAAASLGAKFWLDRGGFHAKVISTRKVGQVHFQWQGEKSKLVNFFEEARIRLLSSVESITANMEKRGGGIVGLSLVDMTDKIENYYQIKVECETCNAMGANFINSILEEMAQVFKREVMMDSRFENTEKEVHIIMCILSNYTPDCVVECSVECPIDELGTVNGLSAREFAEKFATAVRIAEVDPNRAVTHNKGIMNGIDAVVLATGNDFRAIEACAHAYAARDGQYRSLSTVSLAGDKFKFSIRIPLAVGTVGGLTSLHPLAKTSLAILENPTAPELMQVMAAVGLAQNFGAVRSLVTTGIQKGHMKLHLLNILNQLGATPEQIEEGKTHFSDKVVSFTAVRNFLTQSVHTH